MKMTPELFQSLCAALEIQTDMGREALAVALENVALLDKKHLDYGPTNISRHGEPGVVIRMDDKLSRLSNLLLKKRRRKTRNEPMEDTYRDICNYAIIGLLLHKQIWR